MMTQKEAVYQAVTGVLTEAGVQFEGDAATHMTKEYRAQVNSILVEGFKSGKIAYDGTLPEDSDLKGYVSGLQSNWLRKDKRLNGNVAYQPKNPGSRAGSTDPSVRAMRLLLGTKTDPAERAEIQGFIDARLAQIKPAKSVEIDFSALPAELASKYSE